MDNIKEFLAQVSLLQEEYGLYIVAEEGIPLMLTLNGLPNPSTTVVYLNSDNITEYNSSKMTVDRDNLAKMKVFEEVE